MFSINGELQLSAYDLVGHLSCRHLTNLDTAVANGALEKPKVWDPLLEILRERGTIHEQNYIEYLKSEGLEAVRIEGVGIELQQVEQTIDAMRAGPQIIIQGALVNERWGGAPGHPKTH